jgi:peroxiredoxin
MVNAELAPGRRFPDLCLPDHVGNERCLSDLAGGDPLLLHFYRGWWCPKEQAYFRKLVRLQDEAEVAYSRFVSVSVDPPAVTAAFRAGLGARWTFLSDEGRRWVHELGLLETTDRTHEPYVPTVFVLEPSLRIHAVFNGYWFWGRPTNEELRQAFREVTRSIRPDWEVPGP